MEQSWERYREHFAQSSQASVTPSIIRLNLRPSDVSYWQLFGRVSCHVGCPLFGSWRQLSRELRPRHDHPGQGADFRRRGAALRRPGPILSRALILDLWPLPLPVRIQTRSRVLRREPSMMRKNPLIPSKRVSHLSKMLPEMALAS